MNSHHLFRFLWPILFIGNALISCQNQKKAAKILYTATISRAYQEIKTDNTSQRITRYNTPNLGDTWLKNYKKPSLLEGLHAKYFSNPRESKTISYKLLTLPSEKISPYDTLIQKYARKINWDWRLISAQIYQESHFNPSLVGQLGAQGLFQIMPRTAKSLGITHPLDPEQNIKGGTKYLMQLEKRLSYIPDKTQRKKFTLAAFNCGLGHILDARRLTKNMGRDPNIWDNNVENSLLKLNRRKYHTKPEVKYGFLNGEITYKYVREIFNRYQHYKSITSSNVEK